MTQKVPRRVRRRRQAMRESYAEFQRNLDSEMNWFIFTSIKDPRRYRSLGLARQTGKRQLSLILKCCTSSPSEVLSELIRSCWITEEIARKKVVRTRTAFAPPQAIERPQRMTIIDDH